METIFWLRRKLFIAFHHDYSVFTIYKFVAEKTFKKIL